jgi:hypothetical protein
MKEVSYILLGESLVNVANPNLVDGCLIVRKKHVIAEGFKVLKLLEGNRAHLMLRRQGHQFSDLKFCK